MTTKSTRLLLMMLAGDTYWREWHRDGETTELRDGPLVKSEIQYLLRTLGETYEPDENLEPLRRRLRLACGLEPRYVVFNTDELVEIAREVFQQ